MGMNWIKVTDRLPIDPISVDKFGSKSIIVATRFGGVFATDYMCGNMGKMWHKFDNCEEGHVTHWMEMPAPPED